MAKATYYGIPVTPGTLRARIDVRKQLLPQCYPDSDEYWRIQRTIADLERQLAKMEAAMLEKMDKTPRDRSV